MAAPYATRADLLAALSQDSQAKLTTDADGNRSRHYAEFVARRAEIPVDVPLPNVFAKRESAAREAEA